MRMLNEARLSREKRRAEAIRPPDSPKLTGRRLEVWNTLAPALFDKGMMEPLFQSALTALCFQLVRVEELTAAIETHGTHYETADGKLRLRPEAAILPGHLKVLHLFLGEFGLTPESLAKIRQAFSGE